jgi:hypothetical protein
MSATIPPILADLIARVKADPVMTGSYSARILPENERHSPREPWCVTIKVTHHDRQKGAGRRYLERRMLGVGARRAAHPG